MQAGQLGCFVGPEAEPFEAAAPPLVHAPFHLPHAVGAYRLMETVPADCLTIEAGAGARLSPDGTRVAFADFEGLVVADLSTGARSRLSRDQYRVVAWSPDGRSVLIVNGAGTFLIDVDSHASRPLGPPLAFGRADIQVAFSPDGLWVAMGGL